MLIKNKYTIEELAAIAAKERVEISINVSPDNTSIDVYPYEKSNYFTYPYIQTSPAIVPSEITTASPLPKTVDVTCSNNTETGDKNVGHLC